MKYDNGAIWAVIPALDAARTLPKVIGSLRKTAPFIRILVVDDGSRDDTKRVLEGLRVEYVSHNDNRGIGASLKDGIDYALNNGARIIVTMGADDQRDTEDILTMLECLERYGCDMVIGSKFLLKGQDMPFARRWGNQFMTFTLNLLYGASFTDVTSGFRVISRKVALEVPDLADRYPFDVDLCIRVLQKGYHCREVPAKVFYRSDTTRMENVFLEGARILATILRRRAGWRRG